MFPNPQDVLPFPVRPNLGRYKKLAKELACIAKSDKENAIHACCERWIHALVEQARLTMRQRLPVDVDRWVDQVGDFAAKKLSEAGGRLRSAQFVIARSHGFESWPKFAIHLERLAQSTSSVSRFETAAEAIVQGNAAKLKRLLRENPSLIKQRSTREHGATLLHYVSANGVEGYRQKTPKNIIEITQILLEAGAEVDAEADVYGGGATTLGLTATSVHPHQAGVQQPLLELLLDHGASMQRPSSAGRGHSLAFACLANGRPEAARFLTGRGAPLNFVTASALGHIDLVKTYFNPDGTNSMLLPCGIMMKGSIPPKASMPSGSLFQSGM